MALQNNSVKWLNSALCGNRELTLKCKLKDPLGVSPSKGNQGTTGGKEKFLLTSVGIEPTTSGLDLPLLYRLSHEVNGRSNPEVVASIPTEVKRIFSFLILFTRANAQWVFHGFLIAL